LIFPQQAFEAQATVHSTQTLKETTMKKTAVLILALFAAILIPALQQLHAAPQTINGVVSDTMCGSQHMMHGKSDAECVQACVRAGSSYALVGKPQAIAPFAGKHVQVTGEIKGSTITMTTISDNHWQ
jgi:hypothetical protein